jgi:hypothetical protein
MLHNGLRSGLKSVENMLTASDVATAIGENKYETPHGLLLKSVVIIRLLVTRQRRMVINMRMRPGFFMNKDMVKLFMRLEYVLIQNIHGWVEVQMVLVNLVNL